MIRTLEHSGTLDMTRNTRNTGFLPPSRGWILAILVTPLLALLMFASPVSAQSGQPPAPTPFITPTPLPAVQAAQQAAAQSQSAVQSSQQQAAQLRAQAQRDYAALLARADEIQRNADAQAAQATQAYSDARAAAAAQNGAAVGEAIGRGESAVAQQRESMAGMSSIVATLTAQHDQDQKANDRLTQIANNAVADKETILKNYTALQAQNDKAQAQAEQDSALSYIVKGFLFIVAAVLLIALIVFVINRRRDRIIVTPAADVSAAQDDNIIDGEVNHD